MKMQKWGWVLLGLGVLFLLQNFGLNLSGPLWGLVFAVGGAGFLWLYGNDRRQWWPLIPGFALLGLGASMLLQPLFGASLAGSLLLGAMGAGFLAVYAVRRANWWAVIPGGALLTLAAVAAQGDRGGAGGMLFFLGLALTFALLYFIGQRWALFPAAGCAVMMLLAIQALHGFTAYLIPLALLLAGAYLLTRPGGGGMTRSGA